MEKVIKVEIKNLKIARSMLQVAGYYDADRISDEEVFNRVIGMIDVYGAEWEEENREEFNYGDSI